MIRVASTYENQLLSYNHVVIVTAAVKFDSRKLERNCTRAVDFSLVLTLFTDTLPLVVVSVLTSLVC